MFTTARYTAADGLTTWSGSPYEVPEQALNWFQGVCLSSEGCNPRLDPQFRDGATGPTDPDPSDPDPTDPTPVSKVKSTPKLKIVRKATTKKAGQVRVRVPRVSGRAKATGKVVVKVKKGKKTKSVTAKLPAGKVKVKVRLPKLAKGKWRVVATYRGDATYKQAKVTKKFKVKK